MLPTDAHTTVTHMRLTDSRFPGWQFEIVRVQLAAALVFVAMATRGGVTQRGRGHALAADALDDARDRVRAWREAELELASDL